MLRRNFLKKAAITVGSGLTVATLEAAKDEICPSDPEDPPLADRMIFKGALVSGFVALSYLIKSGYGALVGEGPYTPKKENVDPPKTPEP